MELTQARTLLELLPSSFLVLTVQLKHIPKLAKRGFLLLMPILLLRLNRSAPRRRSPITALALPRNRRIPNVPRSRGIRPHAVLDGVEQDVRHVREAEAGMFAPAGVPVSDS